VIAVIKEVMLDYKKRKLKTKNFVDSGYLMTKPNGGQLYPDTIYNTHRRFMMSHPELRYLSLHKLRHTFASISISHNVDIISLKETLGHSNASVTLDTYSHGYFGNKVKQADLLDVTIFSKNKSAI
jgi:integrase